MLPLRANHAIGTAIGWAVHKLPNRNSRIIQRNLELCFPQLDNAERQALTKRNLLETGKNITELGPFWHWNKQQIESLRVNEVGRALFDDAKAQGKGVIIASPHFGAWELAGLLLSLEAPIHFLYRPNRKSHLDQPVIASRERFGGKCYPITSRGLAGMVRALKKGEAIAILPDQEPAAEHGVFAPLYGVPAYTMTFMANLAQRTKAPVIFTAVERLPKGLGYRVHYFKPDDDLYNDNEVLAAAALNRCVEKCIDIAPSQYMWNYKRFKKAPEGVAARY